MLAHATLRLMLLVADGGTHGRGPRSVPAGAGPARAAAGAAAGYVPAPVPDPRFDVPGPRAKPQVELVPALTDTQAYAPLDSGFAPGSAFDRILTRRSQPQTAIGNQLAPGLTLRIPLP